MATFGQARFVISVSGEGATRMAHHLTCPLYNTKLPDGDYGADWDYSCVDASELKSIPIICNTCKTILLLESMLVFAASSGKPNANWKAMTTTSSFYYMMEDGEDAPIRKHVMLFSLRFYELSLLRIPVELHEALFFNTDMEHFENAPQYLDWVCKTLIEAKSPEFTESEIRTLTKDMLKSFNVLMKKKTDFSFISSVLVEHGLLCPCKKGFFNRSGNCVACTDFVENSPAHKGAMERLIKNRASGYDSDVQETDKPTKSAKPKTKTGEQQEKFDKRYVRSSSSKSKLTEFGGPVFSNASILAQVKACKVKDLSDDEDHDPSLVTYYRLMEGREDKKSRDLDYFKTNNKLCRYWFTELQLNFTMIQREELMHYIVQPLCDCFSKDEENGEALGPSFIPNVSYDLRYALVALMMRDDINPALWRAAPLLERIAEYFAMNTKLFYDQIVNFVETKRTLYALYMFLDLPLPEQRYQLLLQMCVQHFVHDMEEDYLVWNKDLFPIFIEKLEAYVSLSPEDAQLALKGLMDNILPDERVAAAYQYLCGFEQQDKDMSTYLSTQLKEPDLLAEFQKEIETEKLEASTEGKHESKLAPEGAPEPQTNPSAKLAQDGSQDGAQAAGAQDAPVSAQDALASAQDAQQAATASPENLIASPPAAPADSLILSETIISSQDAAALQGPEASKELFVLQPLAPPVTSQSAPPAPQTGDNAIASFAALTTTTTSTTTTSTSTPTTSPSTSPTTSNSTTKLTSSTTPTPQIYYHNGPKHTIYSSTSPTPTQPSPITSFNFTTSTTTTSTSTTTPTTNTSTTTTSTSTTTMTTSSTTTTTPTTSTTTTSSTATETTLPTKKTPSKKLKKPTSTTPTPTPTGTPTTANKRRFLVSEDEAADDEDEPLQKRVQSVSSSLTPEQSAFAQQASLTSPKQPSHIPKKPLTAAQQRMMKGKGTSKGK
jgi:hypothetical protein